MFNTALQVEASGGHLAKNDQLEFGSLDIGNKLILGGRVNCPQPFCVIHTQEESPQIQEVAQKIRLMDESGKNTLIPAWDGDYCLQLKPQEIFRIYSMDKKVFLESEKESLLLKMRLYEFEDLAEKCGWTDFIRISNTDIANFSKVTALDMSISGQVKVNFTNGKTAMVSRRYMKKIRDLLNLVHK